MPLRRRMSEHADDEAPDAGDVSDAATQDVDAEGDSEQTPVGDGASGDGSAAVVSGEVIEVADPPAVAPRRRRWGFLRRRTAEPPPAIEAPGAGATPSDGTADASADAAEDVPSAPRRPVGKSGRTPKTVAGTENTENTENAVDAVDVDGTGEAEEAEEQLEAGGAEETGETADAAAEEPVDSGDDGAAAPTTEVTFVAHRPAGKRLQIAVVAAAALFVGAAAFAGATLQPYLADRAAADTKVAVAQTAADAITTLWSYTPDDMDTLADRASRFLGGDFAAEYRRYIDAIVETNKQAQVTNTTQVMGTAVESLTADEATAIVYTNSVATSPVSKNIPSLRYLSYRLTLERDKSDWHITRMNAVTQLDLTPQL